MRRGAILVGALVIAAIPLACGARTGLGADIDVGAPLDATSEDAARVPCIPGQIALTRARPAVMFVLDRSRSMADTIAGRSRWLVLTEALAATLPSVDETMQIGALLYPLRTGGQSCDVPKSPDIALATNNVNALITRMRALGPSGATPTADAIDVAGKAIVGFRAAQTARALVLATDGAPGCNASLDPRTCRCMTGLSCTAMRCLDDQRTVERIRTVAQGGVPTYVIGIHGSRDVEFSDVLDAMAIAGGRPRSGGGHRYYAATSATELNDALSSIRDQVSSCTFLTTSVPSAEGSITIFVDGQVVPFAPNGGDGWRWSDEANGELLLVGAACPSPDTEPSIVADVSCETRDAALDAISDASSDAESDAAEESDP